MGHCTVVGVIKLVNDITRATLIGFENPVANVWRRVRKIRVGTFAYGEKTAKVKKIAFGGIENDNSIAVTQKTVRLDNTRRRRLATERDAPTIMFIRPIDEITGVRIDRRTTRSAVHAIRESSRRWLIATIAVQI